MEAVVKTDPGRVVFFDLNGNFLSQLTVGALPDMVAVTPNGTKVLVANEGEPNLAYTIDPIGSVSIIDITGGLAGLTAANVTTLDFSAFTPAMLPGVRIFGPGASVAQDMEPEYITVSDDSQTAFVTCQENNAIARINLNTNIISAVTTLGLKDHSLSANSLDPSDSPAALLLGTWPVKGMYQPDAIKAFTVGGQTYTISANEGDAREYGTALVEGRRLSNAAHVLDPTVFPNAATLKLNPNLGRLNVSRSTGDLDNDGDFDEIHVFGSRSVTIRDANGAIVWDSGDQLETITAAAFPTQFNCNHSANGTFDSRSDDKGPEPEAVTVGEVGGQLYAFVGLERIGGIVVFNITNPAAPTFVQYLNHRNFAGNAAAGTALDLGLEGITFVSAANSPTGQPFLITSNEISGTVSTFGVNYRLQLLHASDFEGGVPATDDAPRFASIVDRLEDQYLNTLKLSSGDNFLPGPFLSAGEDPSLQTPLRNAYINYYGGLPFANNDLRPGIGRVDISIMNILGIQASVLGNHEFDLGTSELRNIIGGVNSGAAIRWFGAQFPYLSSNLNFSADPVLSPLFTATRQAPGFFQSNPTQTAAAIAATRKLAPSTIITVNGERFGVVGVTTPVLASISSPGATTVSGPGAGTNDMALLATIVQPVINDLRNIEGINKIILLSHLQQLSLEKQLAQLLNGVDIIVAGGSHTLMADATDRMRTGDTPVETYPFLTTGLDGDPVAIVNTTSEYKYVGRLVVDFDVFNKIIPSSISANISGAYAADDQGVIEAWGSLAAGFTPGSKGQEVKNLCDAVRNVIIAKDGNLFGKTSVFLEGRRNLVRTEETNLGNLSAEANAWMARRYQPTVRISIKNGGGIRSAIGVVNAVGNNVTLEPPAANPIANKLQGDISQLDIENSLRFNNLLSTLTLTAANLRTILEHGVSASGPGQTQGRFPQVSGVRFSYNETLPANARIRNAVITDSAGVTMDTLVVNGALYGSPTRTFRVVTLNFLAGGGDGYPFNTLGTGRVDLNTLPPAGPGVAGFAIPGSEQDAFAEYMKSFHSTTPYSLAETPASVDERIQELNDRPDCILPPRFFADGENDGLGDPSNFTTSCPGGAPAGFVANNTDLCPLVAGTVGSSCDDGNALTGNDILTASCQCLGLLIDCLGVPGGTAVIGSACNDSNAATGNDVFGANCVCAGQLIDCLGVPGGNAVVGSICDAQPGPGFNLGAFNASCTCVTIPCTENVTIELRTDANSAQAGWEIIDQNASTVICSGGQPSSPYPNGVTSPITANCCLPVGCYRLRVLDSAGDGYVSGGINGGYQLREGGPTGRRIIDNMPLNGSSNVIGNFGTGSVSTLANNNDNGAFCVPLSNDRVIFSSCDKQDWVNFQFVIATENAAVSAVFVPNPTNSGYDFWFYDPNGSYSYRRFRSHSTTDGFGSGATRACHFKINGWINSVATPHIPNNVLLNVRVRGRVNGVNQPFGPACIFKMDQARAACPLVKLQDNPLNLSDFSCGVTRNFGGASSPSNRIVANPPQFQPAPLAGGTGLRYQFRFRIPGEAICIVRPPQLSPTMVMNWATGAQLQCGKTYLIDVRVSKDLGATWCIDTPTPSCSEPVTPWGKVCSVLINTSTLCPNFTSGSSSLAQQGTNGGLTMYPNPNRGDQVFLSLSEVSADVRTVTVDIYDLSGKRIVARTIAVQASSSRSGGNGYFNTALELNGDLAGGMYMVNITAGDKTYTERLVIQP